MTLLHQTIRVVPIISMTALDFALRVLRRPLADVFKAAGSRPRELHQVQLTQSLFEPAPEILRRRFRLFANVLGDLWPLPTVKP